MRTEQRAASPTGVVRMKREGDLKFPWLPEQGKCPALVWIYEAGALRGVGSQSWQTSAPGYFFKLLPRKISSNLGVEPLGIPAMNVRHLLST